MFVFFVVCCLCKAVEEAVYGSVTLRDVRVLGLRW
jgi:hypothetical protein